MGGAVNDRPRYETQSVSVTKYTREEIHGTRVLLLALPLE